MPGGKIAFYTGILEQLALNDDEVAMIMGHEMAHALREHARERLAKSKATGIGLSVASQLLGLGQLGDVAANVGTQLLSLKYSRDDETEADLVGLEIAARGGAKCWRPTAAAKAALGFYPHTPAATTGFTNWKPTYPKSHICTKRPEPAFNEAACTARSGPAHIRVAAPLLAKRAFWPVSGNEHGLVPHGPQPLGDAGNQSGVITLRKICAANAAGKQHITHKGAVHLR